MQVTKEIVRGVVSATKSGTLDQDLIDRLKDLGRTAGANVTASPLVRRPNPGPPNAHHRCTALCRSPRGQAGHGDHGQAGECFAFMHAAAADRRSRRQGGRMVPVFEKACRIVAYRSLICGYGAPGRIGGKGRAARSESVPKRNAQRGPRCCCCSCPGRAGCPHLFQPPRAKDRRQADSRGCHGPLCPISFATCSRYQRCDGHAFFLRARDIIAGMCSLSKILF